MSERIKKIAQSVGAPLREGDGLPQFTDWDDFIKFAEFLLDEVADELREIANEDYQTDLFDAFGL